MMQLSGGMLVILTEEAEKIMKKLKRFLMVLSLAAVGCMSGDRQALAQVRRAQRAVIQTVAGGTERVTMSETNLSVFPRGEKNDAYAQYFVGQSYLQMLSTERVVIGNVTFEPGCRNNWHIHHKGGQILLVTGGRGYYQQWGQPARELHPGDVVNIPPEVKHWHGAAPDSWFAHLAVEVPADGAANEWLEPVTEAEYNILK